jgi:hypothetical protein
LIPQWGNSSIRLFSQPWLVADRDIDSTLAADIGNNFDGISDDRCSLWNVASPGFNDATADCIFEGDLSQHDPIRVFETYQIDVTVKARVKFKKGTLGSPSASLLEEQIDVCSSDGARSGDFLQQRCSLETYGQTRTAETEGFA